MYREPTRPEPTNYVTNYQTVVGMHKRKPLVARKAAIGDFNVDLFPRIRILRT